MHKFLNLDFIIPQVAPTAAAATAAAAAAAAAMPLPPQTRQERIEWEGNAWYDVFSDEEGPCETLITFEADQNKIDQWTVEI